MPVCGGGKCLIILDAGTGRNVSGTVEATVAAGAVTEGVVADFDQLLPFPEAEGPPFDEVAMTGAEEATTRGPRVRHSSIVCRNWR